MGKGYTIQARKNSKGEVTSYRALCRYKSEYLGQQSAPARNGKAPKYLVAWAEKTVRDYLEGRLDPDAPKDDGLTMREYLARFRDEVLHDTGALAKKSCAEQYTAVTNWWIDHFSPNVLAKDVTKDMIDAGRDRLVSGDTPSGRPLAPKSVRYYLVALSAAFTHSMERWEGEIKENPVKRVKKPSKDAVTRKPRLYHRDEINSFLMALGATDSELADYAITLLETGCRKAEIQNLKRGQVVIESNGSGERGYILVRGKGDKDRIAFLHSRSLSIVKQLLAEQRSSDDYLFFPDVVCKENAVTEKHRRSERITRNWDAVRKASGCDITRHGLRHAFASNVLMSGANLKDVQQLLGHADIQTTANIYSHLTPEHLFNVSSAVNNLID